MIAVCFCLVFHTLKGKNMHYNKFACFTVYVNLYFVWRSDKFFSETTFVGTIGLLSILFLKVLYRALRFQFSVFFVPKPSTQFDGWCKSKMSDIRLQNRFPRRLQRWNFKIFVNPQIVSAIPHWQHLSTTMSKLMFCERN